MLADLRFCCSSMTKTGFLMMRPIFRYIGRTSAILEGKEFVASNFMMKKQLLIYHSGGHFCRGFIENKFALTPSICVRNGTMRLFV